MEGDNVFDFNAYKKKWEEEGEPQLVPPLDTFEINKEYDFDPTVKSHAYYNEERTLDNEIGERFFAKGKCLRYLKKTEAGPMFLFSGRLTNEINTALNGIMVYFGVIHNKTDPERSRALEK